MKALLFMLIRAFEFSSAADIEMRQVIVSRPYLRGQESEGPQMPLIVKLVDKAANDDQAVNDDLYAFRM